MQRLCLVCVLMFALFTTSLATRQIKQTEELSIKAPIFLRTLSAATNGRRELSTGGGGPSTDGTPADSEKCAYCQPPADCTGYDWCP